MLRKSRNHAQVYLVTGGHSSSDPTTISSTEILTVGDSTWTEIAPYPFNVGGLKGISFQNKILIS